MTWWQLIVGGVAAAFGGALVAVVLSFRGDR